MKHTDYTAEDFTRELPAEEYLNRFRDKERIEGYCRQCPNYGRSWGCPPFDHDIAARHMRPYSTVLLTATRIVLSDPETPFTEVGRLILPERRRLEQKLLDMERRRGGRAFAYIGTCLYCPPGECTRPKGLPCRHPDKVRPSLEACGFDIAQTTRELFGMELKWSDNGKVPEYLLLVCGFFHNKPHIEWNE